MTTYGGDAGVAYQIARLLQSVYGKFYLCVPIRCKSAGTLIALRAAGIYMQPVSELGPLDVQLRRRDEIGGRRRSGMVVRTALEALAEETFKVFERATLGITIGSSFIVSFDVASRIATSIAAGVMAPVYAQVDPESLGNDLRDLFIAKAYGERLAKFGGNATNESVRRLVEDYPTHEFIIDGEEASEIFSRVDLPTSEMSKLISALGEQAYSVRDHHLVQRLDSQILENQNEAIKRAGGGTGTAATSDLAEGCEDDWRDYSKGQRTRTKSKDGRKMNGNGK